MKIFISWSGNTSHKVAKFFKEYLPHLVQGVETFLSSVDTDIGVRWHDSISKELDKSNFGIICISSVNQNAPWLLFEAGALSKKVDESKVTPVLINTVQSELKGPLKHFQGISLDKNGLFSLMKSINKNIDEPRKDEILEAALDVWWSKIENSIIEILRIVDSSKYYYIVAKHSRLYLQVENPNLEIGGNIIQSTQHGNDHQKWKFVFQDDHYFQIVSKKDNDFCLDIPYENHKKRGVGIQIGSSTGCDNQLWEFIEVEDEVYHLRSKLNSFCLDVKASNKDAGAKIQQFPCHRGNNQSWLLEVVNEPNNLPD